MKKIILLSVITHILLLSCNRTIVPALEKFSKVQLSNSWDELKKSPSKHWRNDDIYFVNTRTGWIVNGIGEVHKTYDSGNTWNLLLKKDSTFFRCIGFVDSLRRWIGTIGPGDKTLYSADPVILYGTVDGGKIWEPVKISGPYPGGLCGIHIVSDSVIVACGRVRGPSYFLRSTNGGKNWISKEMNTYAGSLVDVHFFDNDNGILVCGITANPKTSKALVLSTTDAGNTWDTTYISSQTREYCWKISFPSRNIGYISIQRNTGQGKFYFLKTIDGGKTWKEMIYSDTPYYVQGIGFVNDSIGWIGGGPNWSFETNDGGQTWYPVNFGRYLNKFRFLNDTMGYAVGKGAYRFFGYEPPLTGWATLNFENGNVKSKNYYEKGILFNKSYEYWQNGHLAIKGRYKSNLRNRIWKYYDEKGNLTDKVKFQHGIAKVNHRIYNEYAGVYELKDSSYRYIINEDGRLFSILSKRPLKLEMLPESDNRFFYTFDFDVKITFFRNSGGKITHSITHQAEKDTKAKKLEGEFAEKLLLEFEKNKKS